MKIYTILGASNGIKYEQDENSKKQKVVSRVKYEFSRNFKLPKLKRESYINMFSLLLDNKEAFGAHEVVAIYTKFAQNKQNKMLKEEFGEDFKYKFDKKYIIEDENNFYDVLKVINKATQETDENSILDLTHGFRHLPILATISLISQNFQGDKNIKYILFAKEFKQDGIDYEIIDLKEYLEIANLSIILENFSQNYTISSSAVFENESYQEIADNLRLVSNHILANSFKKLYNKNTLDHLIINLENLQNDKKLSSFNFKSTLEHIMKLKSLENKKEHEKFYELSLITSSKGYLLNSITLLYEASALYCVNAIGNISLSLKNHINNYLKLFDNDIYRLSGESRKMVLLAGKNRKTPHPYLYNPQRHEKSKIHIDKQKKKGNYLNEISKNLKNEIFTFLDKLNQDDLASFRIFLNNIKALRDNLAHGNSSDTIENAKQELKVSQENFNLFCRKNNILKV